MKTPTITIRPAHAADLDAIDALAALSARELAANDYPEPVIESALRTGAWGVDPQLVRDQTCYVVFVGERLAACGSWSFRPPMLGRSEPDANALLDPAIDAARIRDFYVHPCFAGRGLGALLLGCCENAGTIVGFQRFMLTATIVGERLYRAHGYSAVQPVYYGVGDGVMMRGLLMQKQLPSALMAVARRSAANSTGMTTLTTTQHD